MVEAYQNRYKRVVIKYIRVVWKEEKIVNRVDQWFIIFCHVDIKGMELFAVK